MFSNNQGNKKNYSNFVKEKKKENNNLPKSPSWLRLLRYSISMEFLAITIWDARDIFPSAKHLSKNLLFSYSSNSSSVGNVV